MRQIGLMVSDLSHISQTLRQKLPSSYLIKEINVDLEDLNVVKDQINACEIVLANPDSIAPLIYDIKETKWVQSTYAGNDMVTSGLISGKQLPSFILTKASVFGRHLSEYVISNIINRERKAFHYFQNQQRSLWKKNNSCKEVNSDISTSSKLENISGKDVSTPPYRLLSSLSISILGVGEVGTDIAKLCKQFNMTVYGMVTKIPDKKLPYIDQYFVPSELNQYLTKSEYVCNALPKTPLTDSILDNDRLQYCKGKQSVFINVGRGNVIRDNSILKAIQNQWIGGAILDVFETEPLPKESALWTEPNVIVTPHVAGISLENEIVALFLKNLELYEKGEPLMNLVNWSKGY